MQPMSRRAKVIRFPKSPAREPESSRSLVELRRCRDQGEALVVRGLLESEGIRVALRGNLVHSIHPFSVGDQGEVIVLVPGDEVEQARKILAHPAPGPARG
jgi:hypothetical protein